MERFGRGKKPRRQNGVDIWRVSSQMVESHLQFNPMFLIFRAIFSQKIFGDKKTQNASHWVVKCSCRRNPYKKPMGQGDFCNSERWEAALAAREGEGGESGGGGQRRERFGVPRPGPRPREGPSGGANWGQGRAEQPLAGGGGFSQWGGDGCWLDRMGGRTLQPPNDLQDSYVGRWEEQRL